MTMSGMELYAPNLLDHELVNVALKKSRAGRPDVASQALADFADLRVTRCTVNAAVQFELANRMNLSAYDAAYLQLALDLGAPLATFDRQLGMAAKEALGRNGVSE